MGHREKDISQAGKEQCLTMSTDRQNSDRCHIQIRRCVFKIRKIKMSRCSYSSNCQAHCLTHQHITSLTFPVKRDFAARSLFCSVACFNLCVEQVPHLRGITEKQLDKMSLLSYS